MNTKIPVLQVSTETAMTLHPPIPEQLNITPFVARQTVNAFTLMEISTQLLADTPELCAGERPCWSVPVLLTSPIRGVVGKVGEIRVDAMTGRLLVDEDTVRRISEDARFLAERSPL